MWCGNQPKEGLTALQGAACWPVVTPLSEERFGGTLVTRPAMLAAERESLSDDPWTHSRYSQTLPFACLSYAHVLSTSWVVSTITFGALRSPNYPAARHAWCVCQSTFAGTTMSGSRYNANGFRCCGCIHVRRSDIPVSVGNIRSLCLGEPSHLWFGAFWNLRVQVWHWAA